MKITCVYSGNDGESHFKEVEIPMGEGENGALHSPVIKSGDVIFRSAGGQNDVTWHTAPRQQFIVVLTGKLEIEVADGSVRSFGPGEVLLAADTTGHGHISRAFNRLALVVPCEELEI